MHGVAAVSGRHQDFGCQPTSAVVGGADVLVGLGAAPLLLVVYVTNIRLVFIVNILLYIIPAPRSLYAAAATTTTITAW